ncbi:nucleolar protein dao-5-like isoform X1 [Leptidea sinapis]|uniref:nucleolar protein dao-5-like isoform X1 n=1 Tax=Leptidea sinapis TaxID=189913 RepID=UPI0021295E07|nr:nucleolar protein dao-5-like isoform X1 [Leptidea sinapis]
MWSQASKPVTKKGGLNKTSLKAKSGKKQPKKKPLTQKKVKPLQRTIKSPKQSKDKVEENVAAAQDASTLSAGTTNVESTKISAKSLPTLKKAKKESKEKKDINLKTTTKKIAVKKATTKNSKSELKTKKVINKDELNQKSGGEIKKIVKCPKSKTNKKATPTSTLKISDTSSSIDSMDNTRNLSSEECPNKDKERRNELDQNLSISTNEKSDENKTETLNCNSNQNILSPRSSKGDSERPPKFFTSTRSPRTVDIDVKWKNSKGSLNVSDRFLSLKCEPKLTESKEKNTTSTLVAQGPEIDVYTFTEKVDSPKSILSDFRDPINKNIGRVRPIARVKGTIIDKKGDSERKKFSPHRPIEEVVKQLKASKKSDANTQNTPSVDLSGLINKSDEPKPIVSKSYKMVARKSSVSGKPFSPIRFLEQDASTAKIESEATEQKVNVKKASPKSKKRQIQKKATISDGDIDSSKFSLGTKIKHYSSSEESVCESNDDNDAKELSETDVPRNKKLRGKKHTRILDSVKKKTSKELKELSKDSLIDLKETSALIGNEKPSKRRLKLLSMWSGPKKHRMASLNAIAKVHCLYENESRSHVELGLMKTVDRQPIPSTSRAVTSKKKETKPKENEKQNNTSESEYETKIEKGKESSDSSDDSPPQRILRGDPGIRSAGKYWDPKSSTSSSEDSELESKGKIIVERKKITSKVASAKPDIEKANPKMKKTAGVPVKKKRNRNEVVMDLKDMVVQKRMASLNATAILAASYEKRSPKSSKDDSTSDSCSDESFSHKPKNGKDSGIKSEIKKEECKKETEESQTADRKQKVEVIVNQDTDVTITGVYSTHHHEGFCTVSGMQYRISSTSHTQTTATANSDKEECSREDGARYTPLSALSSMQPPADHIHPHPHPVPELGGLGRRAGCSSAFSAPSPSAHHDPGKENIYTNIRIGYIKPKVRTCSLNERNSNFLFMICGI